MGAATKNKRQLAHATKVFGTDGVRGEAGSHITPAFCIELGIAAGLYFRALAHKNKIPLTNKILLGKDTRRSGYMIEKIFSDFIFLTILPVSEYHKIEIFHNEVSVYAYEIQKKDFRS